MKLKFDSSWNFSQIKGKSERLSPYSLLPRVQSSFSPPPTENTWGWLWCLFLNMLKACWWCKGFNRRQARRGHLDCESFVHSPHAWSIFTIGTAASPYWSNSFLLKNFKRRNIIMTISLFELYLQPVSLQCHFYTLKKQWFIKEQIFPRYALRTVKCIINSWKKFHLFQN